MQIVRHVILVLALCAGLTTVAVAQDKAARPRGELLYSTFCVACHTTQAHWRDKRIATDMQRLRDEVRRWQRNVGQNWSDADIEEVVQHLNRLYYKYPVTSGKG
jgi:cytochrome c553